MKKSVWFLLIVFVMGALALSACGGGGGGGSETRQDPPADYANLTNPFAGQADAVSAGQQLFATNCATCHGEKAMGDGPAGAALDPKPANLQQTAKETTPAYQNWVISEGGGAAGLNSSMVSYKNILTADQIWQIVSYLDETYGK